MIEYNLNRMGFKFLPEEKSVLFMVFNIYDKIDSEVTNYKQSLVPVKAVKKIDTDPQRLIKCIR